MSKITFKSLRKYNLIMAGLHAVQGAAIVVTSREFNLPLKTDHLSFNVQEQALELAQATVFDISLPMLIASFFFISALAHLIIATVYRDTYEADLKKGINKARWIEYSISASIMMVAISLLVGIYDVVILASVFALASIMNLMGLVMEVVNQGRKKPSWLSFNIGTYAGLVPWLIIAYYFWASAAYADANPPTFVYYIFISIFIFFSSFALNMVLQYKKIGKWSDYLYGERAYIILSLVAKSVLAWQVYAGTLQPV